MRCALLTTALLTIFTLCSPPPQSSRTTDMGDHILTASLAGRILPMQRSSDCDPGPLTDPNG